jgi:DNA polymerase III subunit delta'
MLSTDPVPGFLSLGQATARAIAAHADERQRLGRTFLVVGPAGSGKGAFVEDLLALLFCTDGDRSAHPCNVCAGCRRARSRTHPDLVVGSPEIWRETRSTGESVVSAARRWLGETAGAPIAGERRVILIEGADRAGDQIQNALLKALEEPSERHMFVLVADEPSRLLETVRSRCQVLRIGPVPRAELTAWLMERERLPRDQADALARISGGLVGRALDFAQHPDRVDWRRRSQRELLDLLDKGTAERFAAAREMLDEATRHMAAGGGETPEPPVGFADAEAPRTPTLVQRAGASLIVEAWLALARDLMVTAAGSGDAAPASELLPDLAVAAQRVGVEPLAGFIGLLERIHDGLAENAAPRLALEVAMLAWPSPPRS